MSQSEVIGSFCTVQKAISVKGEHFQCCVSVFCPIYQLVTINSVSTLLNIVKLISQEEACKVVVTDIGY